MSVQRRQRVAAAFDRRLVARAPRRPLLIGQAPSRHGEGWPALSGRPGDVLARLAGLEHVGARPALALMVATERRNLLERWPGPRGAGDAFPLDIARSSAVKLLEELAGAGRLEGRRVVYLGLGVARAFAHRGAWMVWRETAPACLGGEVRYLAAALPHPSGRNRWYNAAANRAAAAAFLRRLLDDEGALAVGRR